MKMKQYIFFALLAILLLFAKLPSNKSSAVFNASEQNFIENVENLTSTADLSEFFEAQSSIYIDNVYSVQQKFFYKLLGDLPKSLRTTQIKRIINEMDAFLEMEDFYEKVDTFDRFVVEFFDSYEDIFEYDLEETKLSSNEFNDIFVANGVEEVLNYANVEQSQAFVEHTGNGIRIFLILNRSSLDSAKMMAFKAVVDGFLEGGSFVAKRESLKMFLQKCQELLE